MSLGTFADLYEGNGPVDARAYTRAGRWLVVLKAGEYRLDRAFMERWRAFGGRFRSRWGLRRCRRGAYVFAHPNVYSGRDTILRALAWIHWAGGLRRGVDIALIVDREADTPDGRFLTTPYEDGVFLEQAAHVAAHFTGRGLILYMPAYRIFEIAAALGRLPRGCRVVWIPGYPQLPQLPRGVSLFAHQFTETAYIPGVGSNCDLSNIYTDPKNLTVTKGR